MSQSERQAESGLTKRDYIAVLALQGILAAGHPGLYSVDFAPTTILKVTRLARECADSLLKELEP